MDKISIAGAGLVGSLLSIYLAKKGHKVSIYERRPDMRKTAIAAGRSINLALSDRGWKGLEGVGIGEEVKKVAIPMYGRMIHNIDGKLNFLPYGKANQAIYSVSRGGLNCLMMDLAEKNGVEIFFNERLAEFDFKSNTLKTENHETKKNTEIKSDVIFGADGAFAASRMQLMLSTDKFNYSQSFLEQGYKELTIPANPGGEFAMEKNALHIWPRGQFMLIALPNLDGSFTCTLFFPFEGENSFAALDTHEKMLKFFNEIFPDAVKLMPTLEHDFFHNPTASLVTIKCNPWNYEDKLLLIGDAAHAIVPFFGQGMNSGFEDCTVLSGLLDKHGKDWKIIFEEFEKLRKPNTDAIAELAVQNFVEMRDLVSHPDFILRKKIEAKINSKYPDKWMPLYSMVTFSDLPYSEALKEGKRQQEIMDKIMAMPEIENKWDSEEVEKEILRRLG
jgi:kynurenine 3-monooxygenase